MITTATSSASLIECTHTDQTLDDLLVLRVENSFDYHVNISVSYLRSCYGVSLEELVYSPQPIRSTELPAVRESFTPGAHQTPKLTVPKELWRLVDALWSGDAIREKDLFQVEPIASELIAVRESIDTNAAFPSCSPHAIATALVSLIEALPAPLLPTKLCPTVGYSVSSRHSLFNISRIFS